MKKILVLSDIHQKRFVLNSLNNIFSKNKIDGVIVLGDLTDRNDTAIYFAKDFYSLIVKYKLLLLYIHGNNEPTEVIDFFSKKNCLLHNKMKIIDGVKFLGLGGWGDEISNYTINNIYGSFFITHIPPTKKLLDKSVKNTPIVHAFGHSHRNEYFEKEGNVFYLSLKSAGYFRRAALISIPDIKVKFIDI